MIAFKSGKTLIFERLLHCQQSSDYHRSSTTFRKIMKGLNCWFVPFSEEKTGQVHEMILLKININVCIAYFPAGKK